MTPPRNVIVRASSRNCVRMCRRPGSERLANADLPCALRDRYEHDVHHADAADHQRERADEIQHELQAVRDAADHGGRVAGVAHVHRARVTGVETVPAREQLSHLANGLLVHLGRDRLKQNVVDEFALVRRVRHEHRQFVRIKVIGDLRLVRHHADHFERDAVDTDGLADRPDVAESWRATS